MPAPPSALTRSLPLATSPAGGRGESAAFLPPLPLAGEDRGEGVSKNGKNQAQSSRVGGIIWLASYPKSGNTWLRLFLANYFAPKRPLDLNSATWLGVGDSGVDLFRSAGIGSNDLAAKLVEPLRAAVQRQLARRNGKGVTFVKTHNACIHVAGAPLITPDVTAGAILVVRNPFDVAVSFAHHSGMPIERAVEALATDTFYVPAYGPYVDQYPTSWRRFQASWSNAAGLSPLILRYEDMVRSAPAAFGQVLEFLRVPLDAARLAESIRATDFKVLARQEKSRGFVEGDPEGKLPFFREGRVGAWRDVLTAAQVEFLRQDCLEELVRLGYARADGALTPMTMGSGPTHS